MQEAITVLDPVTMEPVPWDGETMGEIMFRGNLVMKGYLKNDKATDEAFAGGWFHTGDLAVVHSRRLRQDQGPFQGRDHLRRREHLLARSRGRALPPPGGDRRRRGRQARREMGRGAGCLHRAEGRCRDCTEAEIIEHCRAHLARFKVPKQVVFGELPKTSTGKIQKYVLRQHANSALAIE